MQHRNQPAYRAGQPRHAQDQNAPAAVAWHGRAVALDQPPALPADLGGHRGEQAAHGGIGKGQQSQLLPAVDAGDEPRRPAAKSSLVVEDEHRARQVLTDRRPSI